jgi:hypothetical protein
MQQLTRDPELMRFHTHDTEYHSQYTDLVSIPPHRENVILVLQFSN